MIFHAAERDLDFVLDGKRYVVPKNSNVEIPDAVAYCVKSHGIALAEGPGAKVSTTVKPTKPVTRARPKRNEDAEEMRRELAEITGGPGDDDDDIDG